MRTLFKLSILVVCVVFIGSCSPKNDTLVAVRDGVVLTEGTPVRFQLKSLFPSPFSGTGTLFFTVYSPQRIRMSIYNADWQEVQVLYDEVYQSGSHELTFKTENLSNGVFYLVAKGESETQILSFVHVK